MSIAAGIAAAPITRVFLLPASDRTSVVVELDRAPKRAVAQPSGRLVIVNIGPLQGAVAAQQLRAANAIVSSVTIGSVTQSSGETMARVEVALRAEADCQVRLVGSRVYIDLALRRSSSPRERPPEATPPPAPPPAPPEKPESALKRPLPAPVVSGGSGTDPVTAFMRRANALATAADVTGLERMKAEWERRETGTAGRDEPDLVSAKLAKLLDEARERRLALDQAEFLEIERDRYRQTIQRVFSRVVAIRSALSVGGTLPPERRDQITADVAALLGALRPLNAPAEFREAHQILVTGLDAALDVTTGRVTDDRRRADAVAMLDRAQKHFAVLSVR